MDAAANAVGPFSVGDLEATTALVAAAWRSGLDRDWTVNAGSLDWPAESDDAWNELLVRSGRTR